MPIVFLQGSLTDRNPEMCKKKKKYGHGKLPEEARMMERISEKPQLFSVPEKTFLGTGTSYLGHVLVCHRALLDPPWLLDWPQTRNGLCIKFHSSELELFVSEDSPWFLQPAKSSYSKESCWGVYRVPSALTPSKCLSFSLYVIRSLLWNTTKFLIHSLTLMLAITLAWLGPTWASAHTLLISTTGRKFFLDATLFFYTIDAAIYGLRRQDFYGLHWE